MNNIKRKTLAICICAGLSSIAFAQDRYQPKYQTDRYDNNPNIDRNYQNNQHNRGFQNYNNQYRDSRDGRYLVKVSIMKDREQPKNYQFRTNSDNEFLVLNSEDITYKVDPDRYNKKHQKNNHKNNDEKYGKVTTGTILRGVITESNNRNIQNVNLKVINNDLMGFGESCHGKRCVNMPQEVLTRYDVKMQTVYGTPATVTQFTNSNGQRVVIKMQVDPL